LLSTIRFGELILFVAAGFDATTEEHLGRDEFGYNDILTTMDAPQAEEVSPSQLIQAPPVGTQPTQPVDGATPVATGSSLAGGATPADGGTPDVVGLSYVAMATPSRPA
jgi:hypothetical protein